ncbi:AsnC family protein, partial [Escherichia coli]
MAMIHEIDDIDKRILNLLQEDATLPLKNIAEKVHASV